MPEIVVQVLVLPGGGKRHLVPGAKPDVQGRKGKLAREQPVIEIRDVVEIELEEQLQDPPPVGTGTEC